MCGLYSERLSAEVAGRFGVENPTQSNAGGEVYLDKTGIVSREQQGARLMHSTVWRFLPWLKTTSQRPSRRPPTRSPTSTDLCRRGLPSYPLG